MTKPLTPEISPAELQSHKAGHATEGLHEIIRNRWSPRAFADRDVDPADLRLLLEAARWAASSNNEQPWRFIVARRNDKEMFAKLLSVLVERNQLWARNAPVLMLTLASTKFARNGAPNAWAKHDAGLALGNLMAQATSMDIATHGMAGFDADKARAVFAIPEDLTPVAALAVGYAGKTSSLDPSFVEAELSSRTRKPLDELIFAGSIA
ncbi:MAG: nitroreductase family protein [Bryobacteraceae bacterium]